MTTLGSAQLVTSQTFSSYSHPTKNHSKNGNTIGYFNGNQLRSLSSKGGALMSNRFRGSLKYSSPCTNLYTQTRFQRINEDFNIWGGFREHQKWNNLRTHTIGSHDQDSESKATPNKNNEGKTCLKNSGNKVISDNMSLQREKHGNGGWKKKRKWQWQTIIQAQEIGILLLQLGVVMFIMRLLRPEIPLPSSGPRVSTAYPGVGNLDNDISSKMHEAEDLVETTSRTKRIVYTTTRPCGIKTPYGKMLENEVEFGSLDKRNGGFFNSGMRISSCLEEEDS
ncbi:hypothetical protein AMTR_s00050p00184070 [Amborella trichopoda]|uniref:Uncharacterized protein n=1 Tax=Amborella trichopoda TaxID=13333 RepID=W1PXE0_AMBTC|nr:hypothetical protein AMTR_s00050p00184070 [Amborella trichopoda]